MSRQPWRTQVVDWLGAAFKTCSRKESLSGTEAVRAAATGFNTRQRWIVGTVLMAYGPGLPSSERKRTRSMNSACVIRLASPLGMSEPPGFWFSIEAAGTTRVVPAAF